MAKSVKRRKQRVIRRANEWDLVPIDKGWYACQYFIHYNIEAKKWGERIHDYIKKHYGKEIVSAINNLPEWKYGHKSHWATAAHLEENAPDKLHPGYIGKLDVWIKELAEEGAQIIVERKKKQKDIVRIPPSIRLKQKTHETIMIDLDSLEDEWCEDNYKSSIDVYKLMGKYDLKGTIPAQMVIQWAADRLADYICVRDKTDDQCVEAYSHMTKRNINSVIKTLEEIINGAESFKNAAKAKRKPRTKKIKSADTQVSKLQFKKEDSNFKVASIDPANIVGAIRLYAFNTKSRELYEYVSQRREGFEVRGTTLQHFDSEESRRVKLRKPEEFLTLALTKTPRQVDNAWSKLGTKSRTTTGRFNNETVILRALSK
ncbi:MAG: hypothetical protein CBB72_011650 [Muricauda sp. TMED12]|nr:MAG: hypothetical protein CBB72_011650 [Muricauda sp. TMED12]